MQLHTSGRLLLTGSRLEINTPGLEHILFLPSLLGTWQHSYGNSSLVAAEQCEQAWDEAPSLHE